MTSQMVEGKCDGDNIFFLSNAIGCAIIAGIRFFVEYLKDRRPVPGGADFGRPFGALFLLFSISFWMLVSSTLYFLMFFFAFPAMFPLNTKMACITISSFPILPVLFFVQGVIVLLTYNSEKVLGQVTSYIVDDSMVTERPAKVVVDDDANVETRESESKPTSGDDQEMTRVLFVGTTARGLFFLNRLKYENEHREKNTETTAVTFGTEEEAAHVVNNGLSIGAVKDPKELRLVRSVPLHGHSRLPLGIPLPSNSFDKAILSPFLRAGPPFGDLMTPESSKQERMKYCLSEVLRTLKSGGKVLCYDAASYALFICADLKELLPEKNITLQENCGKLGAVKLFERDSFLVTATKPQGWAPPQLAAPVTDPPAAAPTVQQLQEDRAEARPLLSQPKSAAPHWIVAIVLTLQACVFAGLCFAAAALYSPTNAPKSLPLNQRASNLFVGIATGYPIMVYFSRSVVLEKIIAHELEFPSLAAFLAFQLKAELLAIGACVLFTVVFSIPTFLLFLALHSTGMSDSVLTFIGIALSLVIVFVSYKRGRKKMAQSSLKQRNIDARYLEHMI